MISVTCRLQSSGAFPCRSCRRPSNGFSLNLRFAFVQLVLGAFPSLTFNRLRTLSLKACGIRIGRASLFLGLPIVKGDGAFASRLDIGCYSGFNVGCVFDLAAPIVIGNHVWVGHEARFITSMTRDGAQNAAPISIGDGAWLGSRCTVFGGITIGEGSVIGAGVTVTEDVPPCTVLAGPKPIPLPP